MKGLSTILPLVVKEFALLDMQARQLRTCSLDVGDLEAMRLQWSEYLGFKRESLLLIQSLDTLIESLELGDYDQELYAEVCVQIEMYKQYGVLVLDALYGPCEATQEMLQIDYERVEKDPKMAQRGSQGLAEASVDGDLRREIKRATKTVTSTPKPRSSQLLDRVTKGRGNSPAKPADVIDFTTYKSKK